MRKKRIREWFDGDQFWRDFYLFMFSEQRFADAAEQATGLINLVKPKGKTVLDLCCGPGRFSLPLAKLGYLVTGVDKTKLLLDKARAKARRAKVEIEWVRQDMRDFVRPAAFDLALSMFTSFGYFERKEDDALVLSNVYRSLRQGGSLVIDLMGKEVLARTAQPAFCDPLPDGSMLVQRPVVVDGWTRVRNHWILIRGGAAKHFTFHNRIYSGQEIREQLLLAGFAEVNLYGSLEGKDYDLQAKRLVAVATKR